MQTHIIRWCKSFQGLILNKFYQKQRAIQALIFLIVGHLYGLFNPNQLADALSTPKSSLYQNLEEWSLPQWKRLLFLISCEQAAEKIQQIEEMSESTKSRRKITLSVDDSVVGRDGKCLSYCYSWFSGRVHKVIKGQNILAK